MGLDGTQHKPPALAAHQAYPRRFGLHRRWRGRMRGVCCRDAAAEDDAEEHEHHLPFHKLISQHLISLPLSDRGGEPRRHICPVDQQGLRAAT